MKSRPYLSRLRDIAAIATVGCFMFPLFWWGLNSIKPADAIFEHRGIVWFGFTPSFANYRATLLGEGPEFMASRQSMLDSIIVASGATLLALITALPAAHALSRLVGKGRVLFLLVLFQRVVPPVVVIMPLVFIYHGWGLRDTLVGVILAHATMNLPFAILLLKSFFDDVPREVGEAAVIDGANRWQNFTRIQLPMIRGGIAATAVLCFIFSWTEFVMALFLTSTIRLLPVQMSLMVTQTWGFTSALSIASMLPVFVFILLVQRHLVRGLTMGLTKG